MIKVLIELNKQNPKRPLNELSKLVHFVAFSIKMLLHFSYSCISPFLWSTSKNSLYFHPISHNPWHPLMEQVKDYFHKLKKTVQMKFNYRFPLNLFWWIMFLLEIILIWDSFQHWNNQHFFVNLSKVNILKLLMQK